MGKVLDGPFAGKTRGEYRANEEMEIDDASIAQFDVFMGIMTSYQVGLKSSLTLFINELQMKGPHITKFLELKEEKGIKTHLIATPNPVNYRADLIKMPGYMDINPAPVFYPIVEQTTERPELAGYRTALKPLADDFKGPAFMYSIDNTMIALHSIYDTMDDTCSS